MANLIWDDAIMDYRYDNRPGEPSYVRTLDPAAPESKYGLDWQSPHEAPMDRGDGFSMSRYALTPDVTQILEQNYRQDGRDVVNLDGGNYVKRQADGNWAYITVPMTTGGARVDPNTGEITSFGSGGGGLFGLGDTWGPLAGLGLVVGAGLGAGFGLPALGVGAAEAGAGAGGGAAAGIGGLNAAAGEVLGGTVGPALGAGGAGAGVAGAAVPAAAGAAGAGAGLAGVGGAAGAAGAGAAGAAGAGGALAGLGAYAPLAAVGLGAVGSVVGAGIQAGAAKDAAQTQADAARAANATQLAMYNQTRADLAPYRTVGYDALAQQAAMTQNPLTYGNFASQGVLDPNAYAFNADPYAFAGTPALDPNAYAFEGGQYNFNSTGMGFTPPSGQQVLNDDPGYQFRVQQGQQALDRQAAGKGQLYSGGQLKGAARFSQDLASQEYGASYGRRLGENQLRYGRSLGENQMAYGRGLEQNQMAYGRGLTQNQDTYTRGLTQNQMGYERALAGNQMTYGRAQTANEQAQQRGLLDYQTNLATQTGLRNLRYNELAGLAGTGQVAVGQGVQAGQQTAANIGNNLTSAGAAQAAGQVGAANALSGGIQGVGNAAGNYLNYTLLSQLMKK